MTFQIMITSNNRPVADILKAIDEGKIQLSDFRRVWVRGEGRICANIEEPVRRGYNVKVGKSTELSTWL